MIDWALYKYFLLLLLLLLLNTSRSNYHPISVMKDLADIPAVGKYTAGSGSIRVECGPKKAVLHLDKLCQGSKGACILFDDAWMTPNEFQTASGRETAKYWKRSIKHRDKSIKLLIIKGLFSTDPAVCSCNYCTGIDALLSPAPPPTTSVTEVRTSNCRKFVQ